jgi:hypothetical protein
MLVFSTEDPFKILKSNLGKQLNSNKNSLTDKKRGQHAHLILIAPYLIHKNLHQFSFVKNTFLLSCF